MKQGTTFTMDIGIDFDLDMVEHIDFLFVQGSVRRMYHYPSEQAVRQEGTNTIRLYWPYEETYLYKSGKEIRLDTYIRLTDSEFNPETEITSFTLNTTLFTEK